MPSVEVNTSYAVSLKVYTIRAKYMYLFKKLKLKKLSSSTCLNNYKLYINITSCIVVHNTEIKFL